MCIHICAYVWNCKRLPTCWYQGMYAYTRVKNACVAVSAYMYLLHAGVCVAGEKKHQGHSLVGHHSHGRHRSARVHPFPSTYTTPYRDKVCLLMPEVKTVVSTMRHHVGCATTCQRSMPMHAPSVQIRSCSHHHFWGGPRHVAPDYGTADAAPAQDD